MAVSGKLPRSLSLFLPSASQRILTPAPPRTWHIYFKIAKFLPINIVDVVNLAVGGPEMGEEGAAIMGCTALPG